MAVLRSERSLAENAGLGNRAGKRHHAASSEERPMDTDDLEPRKAKPQPKNLDPMSVEELAAYVEDLKAEIRRVEENMQKKKAHLSAAAGLFKS
jgi:uncharacterized small protein (DUF1192 family)